MGVRGEQCCIDKGAPNPASSRIWSGMRRSCAHVFRDLRPRTRQLGTRLIDRSTRRFQLTPGGSSFYERTTRILADIEGAERNAGAGERPVGRVRLNTSASYATHVLTPVLHRFLERYPEVTLESVQMDAVIDLLMERTDVVARPGLLKSSRLIARRLDETTMLIAGAPSYLRRCGDPKSIADQENHQRLGFGYVRAVDGWPPRQDGQTIIVPTAGQVQVSDGEALRQLALGGNGLARLAAFTVR
jgi:DNA-binding transcriptional LysR family regulator